MRILLREGVTAQHALGSLRPLIMEAGNIASAGIGPNGVAACRDAYLTWAESVESHIAHLTHDRELIGMLQTDRYWHIRRLSEDDARPMPLVDAEITVQRDALRRLVDDLERRVQRVSAAPNSLIAVLDTNVLLHYQEPPKVRWTDVLGVPDVRLVIPLRVIEELDAKKYSASPKLSTRARALLPQLERLIGADGSPSAVAEHVTIEVPVEPGPRTRPEDADGEILGFCVEIRQLVGSEPTLVTGDTAMRLRASAQGTRTIALPDKYRREAPEA